MLAPAVGGRAGRRASCSGPATIAARARDRRRRAARAQRAGRAGPARRLRPLLGDVGRPEQHHLRRRGPERVRRRVARLPSGVRNYHNAGKVQASSEPQDMRLQRMLGHLTHLIPKHAEERRSSSAAAPASRPARCRSARTSSTMTIAEIEPLVPRVGRQVLRRAQLQRRREPEGHDPHRRRAALPADDEREVRRDHVRSARSVGQGRGDALHAGVLRGRQAAPESRRRRDAVRAALREQHGGGEERDRHVLRGVPERRRLGQHEQRPGLRPGADGPGRADEDRRRRDGGEAATSPEYAQVAQSLREIGFNSAIDLFSTYAGQRDGPGAVAEGRADQPRPQPAAAVPGRAWA